MSGSGPKQTAVYVTGLPEDVTLDEINAHFSKVGVIMNDMFTGGPRIKIYENEEGVPKGDALVVFLCEPSVKLAETILDESQLRPGIVIRVHPASFNKQIEATRTEPAEDEPSAKQRKVDKETWRRQMKEMKRKIAWDADEEEGVAEVEAETAAMKAHREKLEKVVVLKHMFTAKELEEDPTAILDIKEDIIIEAEKIGPVTSVYLFDQSEDGRCAVKFKSTDSATKCVAIFDGRYFGGQRVKAELYDGSFRLRETKVKANEEEEERLNKFSEWLEERDDEDTKSDQ